jgi:hypothetical protein
MMSIQEAVKAVAKSLKAQVHINYIMLALVSEGFTKERATTIVGWARQTNERTTI